MTGSAATQMAAIARRSVRRTVRQPVAVVPAVLFPLLFLLVTNAGANAAATLPGFPSRSYLAFGVAGTFVFGSCLGGLNSGADLASDLETGFLKRLSLTPMPRTALLAGQVMGAVAVGLVQAVVFLAVTLGAGVEVAAGLPGMPVIVGLTVLVSIALSAAGFLLALKTRSSEAVQGALPLFFVVLIFSSFLIPRPLMTVGWFHAVATYNPASYFIEGIRGIILTGWDARALMLAFGLAGGVAILCLGTAAAALKKG